MIDARCTRRVQEKFSAGRASLWETENKTPFQHFRI
jgi:hypothetical protein